MSLRERVIKMNASSQGQEPATQSRPKKARKPKRYAIFSDIHANIPAFKAAMEHAKDIGKATSMRVLGDVVGYFPFTTEILDYVMDLGKKRVLKGNHEEMMLMASKHGYDENGLRNTFLISNNAARSLTIGKKQIAASKRSQEYNDFMESLPYELQIAPRVKGIHGFREPGVLQMRYVMPRELMAPYGITSKDLCEEPARVITKSGLFNDGTDAVFTGHVHVPFLMSISPQGNILGHWVPNRDNNAVNNSDEGKFGLLEKFTLRRGEKAIISAGSVGISRRDEEAIVTKALHPGKDSKTGKPYEVMKILPIYYCIYDEAEHAVEFYEVFYDYSLTEKAIERRGFPDMFKKYRK